jgi:type II secretory ATPase GspE/PulE/Tfp pilus assembly ATPase PilB-like protein
MIFAASCRMHDLPGATYMSQVIESDTETRPCLLPFAFARRFGVAITTTDGAQPVDVAYRKQPDLTVLAELRRFAGAPIALRQVSDEEFESILSAAYSRDSSQARQMVEDMGDELDLASLADSVPETEDLLDQEDDAPIIRLINALLAEAIRENASDIHIETFEKQLVVRFRVDGVMREIVQFPGSRSWRSSTSPRNESPKMDAFRYASAAEKSMYGCRLCRPATANASCCDCSTNKRDA